MSNGLSGQSALAYQGTNAPTPSNITVHRNRPTPQYYQGFSIGDLWVYRPIPTSNSNELWVLMGVAGNVANWVLISTSTGALLGLTGNSGGFVGPTLGNINVVGSGGILVAGNPGTSTLTISPSGGSIVSSLTTDDTHVVTPTAGTIILHGTHGLNTTGTVGPNTATIAINNAITLGDLATISPGSYALTCTTGDIHLAASTASAATNQKIVFGSSNNHISFLANNVFIGTLAGNDTLTLPDAIFNFGVGSSVLNSLTTGTQNCAFGNAALEDCTTGSNNQMMGYTAGFLITTGSSNVGIGSNAFSVGSSGLTTGSFNIGLGTQAGFNYTGAESSNILLNNNGVVGESHILRIGAATGTGNQQLSKAFVAGIRGVTTDAADAVAVLISSTGQLGTVSSSIRYKENVQDMGDSSSPLMELRPVTFNYKNQQSCKSEYGLIAEEVAELFPDLVVYDNEGNPETIKYHILSSILLNELQKLSHRVKQLEERSI